MTPTFRHRPVRRLDEREYRLLSRIARLRPLPHSTLSTAERGIVEGLRADGLVRWSLDHSGSWSATDAGLDALGAW